MVTWALTWKRRPSSSATLTIVISALKVVKATSDAISSVPLLGIVASAALRLTETLQVGMLSPSSEANLMLILVTESS